MRPTKIRTEGSRLKGWLEDLAGQIRSLEQKRCGFYAELHALQRKCKHPQAVSAFVPANPKHRVSSSLTSGISSRDRFRYACPDCGKTVSLEMRGEVPLAFRHVPRPAASA